MFFFFLFNFSPFTNEIYAKRDRERKEGKEGKKAE